MKDREEKIIAIHTEMEESIKEKVFLSLLYIENGTLCNITRDSVSEKQHTVDIIKLLHILLCLIETVAIYGMNPYSQMKRTDLQNDKNKDLIRKAFF